MMPRGCGLSAVGNGGQLGGGRVVSNPPHSFVQEVKLQARLVLREQLALAM